MLHIPFAKEIMKTSLDNNLTNKKSIRTYREVKSKEFYFDQVATDRQSQMLRYRSNEDLVHFIN